MSDDARPRCAWPLKDPVYCAYHDTEWGVPEWDSRALWEKLMLDGFQAGLSWITILRKRNAFRRAFRDFDPEAVARFGEAEVADLLFDAGIVRSRAKIEATIGNARAYLAMRDRGEDFSAFIWDTVGGTPLQNAWQFGAVPVETVQSHALSKALKARGFKFVGPVIVYAWMEAVGLVNDHVVGCFRHAELGGAAAHDASGLRRSARSDGA
ncbi:MAG: DNA-3-methyladenine glycosylase I [Janthinobacterium lividum]